MSTHTPGPWTFGSMVIVADAGGTFNVRVASLNSIRDEPEISGPERQANGHLIAAAPDLLAACVDALSLLEGVADEEDRVGKHNAAINVRATENRLRAAIVQARGGQR